MASKEDLIAPFRLASELEPALVKGGPSSGSSSPTPPRLKGVMAVSDEKLVSSDYLSTHFSSMIDVDATVMLNSTTAKIVAWYDNEVGFSSRMCDLVVYMSECDRVA